MTVLPPEPWQQAFVDQLNAASRDHRADLNAARQQHRCVGPPVGCGRVLTPSIATHFRDQASRNEYDVSGMCQSCQDATFPGPTSEEVAAMAADPDRFGRCGACGEYRELEFVDVGVGVISGFDCCRPEDVRDLPRCSATNRRGWPCSLGADHAHHHDFWPPLEVRNKLGNAMGWLVLKVNRDPAEDRWCLWSTIVEAPVFDGTEADMTRMYVRQYGEIVRRELVQRIERAKTHGAGTDWEGDWDGEHTGMIYKQMGIMPRDKLGELLDIVTSQERPDEAVRPLLEPFDD